MLMNMRLKRFIDKENEKVVSRLQPDKENDSGKRYLYLTNRRVIKYKKNGKDYSYKDVPLEHITSVEFEYNGTNWEQFIPGAILLIAGVILFAIGYYVAYDMPLGGLYMMLSLPLLIIGIVYVIRGLSRFSLLKLYSYDDEALIEFKFTKNVLNRDIETFIRKIHWMRDYQKKKMLGDGSTEVNVVTQPAVSEQQGVINGDLSEEVIGDTEDEIEDYSVFVEDDEEGDEFWEDDSNSYKKEMEHMKSEIKSSVFEDIDDEDDEDPSKSIECPACGKKLPLESKFCVHCGLKFASDDYI